LRRPFALLAVLAAALVIPAWGGGTAWAQGYRYQRAAPPPEEDDGFHVPFLDFLFGPDRRQRRPPPQYRRAPPQERPRRAPGPPRRAVHAPPAHRAPPKPTTFVAVLGDAFADELAAGLSDALSDHPEVGIVLDVDDDKGLLDKDADWQKMARQIHAQSEKVAAVVVMLGPTAHPPKDAARQGEAADDEPDSEGGGRQPRGPAPWVDLYAAKVDGLMLSLRQDSTPVIWVGLPPVSDPVASTNNAAVNRLVRQRVAALGGIFVDPWDNFTDSDGNFIERGPDVEGRLARLRAADGIHFTEAGARELAQAVVKDLRPLLAADNGEASAAAAALVAAQPHVPGTSRIILLNVPPRSPGATLLPAATTVVSTDADLALAERAQVQGLPVPAKAGRADDYRWPPGEK